jgi:hypothetical protein
MGRHKKVKILESEIPENINELINKVKDLHPDKKEEIENLQKTINNDDTNKNDISNISKKSYKKEQKFIVVDKVDNYYFDDFNGVWHDLNLIGAYDKDKKVYLYEDTKNSLRKILEKKK